MNKYTYVPTKNIKKISALLIILISAAAGFLLFPTIFPEMSLRWLFQGSAIACLGAMIFVVTRYVMKKTVYELSENDDGGFDFSVTEITNGGRTRVTVCRFDVNSIEEIALFHRENEQDCIKRKQMDKRARREHRAVFNYCPDILSSPVCYVFVNEGVGPFLVKLAPDKVLYDYLTKSEN